MFCKVAARASASTCSAERIFCCRIKFLQPELSFASQHLRRQCVNMRQPYGDKAPADFSRGKAVLSARHSQG